MENNGPLKIIYGLQNMHSSVEWDTKYTRDKYINNDLMENK